MQVERACIGDIDELVNIRIAYLNEDHGKMDELTEEKIRSQLPEYFCRHIGDDLLVYVIRNDGKTAACAFLLLVEKPMSPSFINGVTATVLNVYTYPQYRHKGYAAQIMRQMLADAEEMDISVIELKSTQAGHRLYLDAGFEDDHSGYQLMKWTKKQKR